MTTKLDAVNEILESLGEPPVASLDTGGTSEEGEAERILDREQRRVLGDGPGVRITDSLTLPGWACNTEWDITLNFASTSLTGTITTGTFTQGEVVTQASSGAQGIITEAYTTTDTTYLICPLDGSEDFDGTNNITGATSGASTATVTSVSNPTSGVIQLQSDYIHARPYSYANVMGLAIRDGRVYDLDGNTDTMSGSVTVAAIRNLGWTSLTSRLQDFVIARAARDFQRLKKRGQIDEALVQDKIAKARVKAEREHRDTLPTDRRPNPLNTRDAKKITGPRNNPTDYHEGFYW